MREKLREGYQQISLKPDERKLDEIQGKVESIVKDIDIDSVLAMVRFLYGLTAPSPSGSDFEKHFYEGAEGLTRPGEAGSRAPGARRPPQPLDSGHRRPSVTGGIQLIGVIL